MSTPWRPRRRDVLLGSAALGAWALSGCGRAGTALQPGAFGGLLDEPAASRFPLGAASGDASSDRAVLWTKYTGATPLTLSVARLAVNPDTGEQVELAHLQRPVTVAEGGFVHEAIESLIPGEVYRYEFREDGGGDVQKASGIFRAALPPFASERLVFTASSCSNLGRGFAALAGAAALNADLHVLLGDTVYQDSATSLAEFRGIWAKTLGSAEYRTLRRTRSMLATWDDHEVRNDWSGEQVASELLQRGEQTYFEHTPMVRNADDEKRIWRSVRWGRTAEFFVLDCRSERKPDTRDSADAEYISKAQMAWLKAALEASPARFKVLVNSVPIGDFPGVLSVWRQDRWMGYPAQREELLTFLEEKVDGAFFLSGDFHMASMNAVSASGVGSRLTEVLVGAVATNSPNPGVDYCRPPQFSFASATENSGVFELDPETGTVRVRWLDATGRAMAERSFRV